MNRIIPLSLIAIATLSAAEVQLAPISVESTVITEVAENASTSADVAQALSTSVPSVDMSRRSAIANDIFIRGQKRDNISVEIDGTKVCGACVNRMDPPISHILASQIDEIEVIEGPYDVTNFGTMSGGVKVKTKAPTKKAQGELNFGLGAWGYTKLGATASGGNDLIRVLVSASHEKSGQYEDGNGDTMAEQVKNAAALPGASAKVKGAQYQTKYEDMDAYTKKSIMAKAFVTTLEDQELRLSVTANRSDDVLYPNSAMDAIYDDSNIYSIEYNIDNVSDAYKNVNIQYYYSDVDHPMATSYRKSAAAVPVPSKDVTNHLKTSMQGIKLKNNFLLGSHEVLVGLDGSKRTWDGSYYNSVTDAPITGPGNANPSAKSINDAETTNMAIFAKLDKTYGDLSVTIGARYDTTHVENGDARMQDNDYDAIGANIFTSYALNKENRIFLGLGQASRVPDGRELYFVSSMGSIIGTDTLDQTTNQEIDLGYEVKNSMFKFKIKGFYSMLSDYIYYQKAGNPTNNGNFVNLDATVYGAELSASVYATDDITVDMGAAYKRGTKDDVAAGQDDDLADMAPLRGNIALNYEYMNNSTATLDVQVSDKWSDIDSVNAEQELDAWTIVNLKAKHAVNKQFDFTFGINNIFDETYVVSNTYFDLTLLDNTMLMNEPGRYVYTNLDFKF